MKSNGIHKISFTKIYYNYTNKIDFSNSLLYLYGYGNGDFFCLDVSATLVGLITTRNNCIYLLSRSDKDKVMHSVPTLNLCLKS